MNSFKEYIREKLKNFALDEALKEFLLSPRPGIIYGGGNQAQVVAELCQFFHKPVDGFLVSKGCRRTMPHWPEVPTYTADNATSVNRQADIILALHESHHLEITNHLKKLGFSFIFAPKDWKQVNENGRRLWLDEYYAWHNFSRRTDSSGEIYLSIPLRTSRTAATDSVYKCYIGPDKVMQSNIEDQFKDIILPSIMDDYAYLCEGPYEYAGVTIQPNDVVLDFGANVGSFSGVAAAKMEKGKVYAFEPTPSTIAYLKKNISFYGNVEICPYAVSDVVGTAEFTVNGDLDANPELGKNSMRPPQNGNDFRWQTITVDTITVDDFVARRKLERVDFIKADIEGAERQMLRGARETLARFAPKLALCTYHLADDPQVMERIIREINPKYTIVHKWSKLYAWCPDA